MSWLITYHSLYNFVDVCFWVYCSECIGSFRYICFWVWYNNTHFDVWCFDEDLLRYQTLCSIEGTLKHKTFVLINKILQFRKLCFRVLVRIPLFVDLQFQWISNLIKMLIGQNDNIFWFLIFNYFSNFSSTDSKIL